MNPRLRSEKETPLFVIGVVFSSMVWLGLLISIVGALWALFALAAVLMAQAIFLAQVKGNGVRLSPRQLPDIYARCQAAAQKLGMAQVPEIYLMQSGGILNAFATKLLSRRFVIIYSSLADSCEDPRQLDFVIGHELGHLAAGHLQWNAFLLPFHLVPLLGAAYSRAREYTCDRCGYEVVGDLDPSIRGLGVLAAGGKFAGQLDMDEFMAQRDEAGNFWMAIRELVSTHPYLCKRVAALKEMSQPGSVRAVSRNALAYPLAPFLGLSAGGVSSAALLVIVYIGVLSAIAIPAFSRYMQAARRQSMPAQTTEAGMQGY